MHIISVNVGLPREVHWKGRRVSTGIFKQPVAGRVVVRRLNLDGDRQADLTVHGGDEKAVYAYPAEQYDYWRQELPGIASRLVARIWSDASWPVGGMVGASQFSRKARLARAVRSSGSMSR